MVKKHEAVTMNMPPQIAKMYEDAGLTVKPEPTVTIGVDVSASPPPGATSARTDTAKERLEGEYSHLIPPMPHPLWFRPPVYFDDLLLCFQDDLFPGVACFGGRGTFKSTSIERVCALLSLPLITVPCQKGLTWDDLRGHTLLQNGNTYVAPGPLTLSIAAKGVLFLDEFNMVSPDVVAALQPLTANKEGQLLLQDGTTVRIPLGWKVAVAYNQGVNYAGTKPINAAMLDRLQPINCPYPERDTEANSLCVQTGASSEDVNRIMDLVDLLRENAEVHGFDLSLRPVIRMIRFRQAGRTWATAFERAILDLVGPPDGIDGEIRTSFKETAIKGGLELWDQESKGNVGVDEFAKRMKECMVVGTEDDVDDSDF